MGSLTNYGETALLKHLITETAYTPVATLYLALATADPGETATGASMNEVANSNGYTRKAIAFGTAATRRITQNATVTYDAVTGAGYGPVTHWAIVDSGTHGAGNALAYGAFTTPKTLVAGNTPSVASGQVYVEITASTGMSDYAANGFLDRMFRNQAFTVSANHVSLHTTTCSDSTPGTECSGGSYARKQINTPGGASPAWEAVASSATQNANAVTFVTATGSWGTVVAMAIFDAASTGNMLFYDNGVADQAVASGDTVEFAIGAIDLSQA